VKVGLVGAELEENLGLRYMTSALECRGHQVEIIPFNTENDIPQVVARATSFDPQIIGMSMVFTGRAREFCRLSQALRDGGYSGHLIAGGHFASFNCERLLQDFPAFDSVALGEGEGLMCALADSLQSIERIPGICYRDSEGQPVMNPCNGTPDDLDSLEFPKRASFHDYFGKPIASVLTSRGCWRNCAFCSINAWYKRTGGKKFRVRSVDNIVAEIKDLYFRYGVRIFNFQDDNFFVPNNERALARFTELRDALKRQGVEGIAIAVKARPDSITHDSIKVLDELGLFRVFLGVENASQRGLSNLNRRCTFEQILNALNILNDFDVHVAFNLLMFEPDTIMDDILTNIRFIERHVENPLNFCRAEAYAGTGLEAKLRPQGKLLGDYFGFDYRLNDPRSEAFHQIANYAFFDRNFSDFGLHYFNMQVDFTFQLLRRFYPQVLTETLRGKVRNFIKVTNLDTYECLCRIYDFVVSCDPSDNLAIRAFARGMRQAVDDRSAGLHAEGERILNQLEAAQQFGGKQAVTNGPISPPGQTPLPSGGPLPYRGPESIGTMAPGDPIAMLLGLPATPIPYDVFKSRLSKKQKVRQ
jgi:anaerobic magnesium-protoporphyrin IX monomethyl ester cyclase